MMTTVGMLHYRKHPHSNKKAFACAAVAKMMGIQFYYFSPGAVELTSKTIWGWIYENNQWKQKQLPFPDVIYNAAPSKSKNQKAIRKKLKKTIPFTSHSIGSKWTVYKKLIEDGKFTENIIPTFKVTTVDSVINFIRTNTKIVFKPIFSNQGRNVYFIEANDENFLLKAEEESVELTINMLEDFIQHKIAEKEYIVQPFIECKTKAGLSYDFRLHVQKEGRGKWTITSIYPRVAPGTEKITSNISSGGYRGELDSFLQHEFSEKSFDIKKMLEYFSLTFASHFDSLYGNKLDELGIDVGIDQSHKLWIYEVNWRPGCKQREFEFAKNFIPYAAYLAKNQNVNEKVGN
ncbi:YheC/YheD family protein [Bacillus timonensis]|nr:YheC/YheD family protein [Bacillus timonensis]